VQPSALLQNTGSTGSQLFQNATVDLLTAVQTGSVSAVEFVINNTPQEELIASNFTFMSAVSSIYGSNTNVLQV